MRVLDLFSGIGGFSLGLERAGMETVAFCEIDPFCQKVLKKHWPKVPIYDDIKTLKADRLGRIDIICGGYPCQPFSQAGKRLGAEDDRHLWPEMARLIASCRPRWVIGENVAGHISMGLDQVLSDLETQEYATRAFVIPACAVDAPHRRDRVWVVSHSISERRREGLPPQQISRQRYGKIKFTRMVEGWRRRSDLPAPRLCGAGDGVPNRVDRLRALGNAVVPQIPEIIGRAIMQADKDGQLV